LGINDQNENNAPANLAVFSPGCNNATGEGLVVSGKLQTSLWHSVSYGSLQFTDALRAADFCVTS